MCSVQLHGDTITTILKSQISIPAELMVAETAQKLFFFLAKRVEDFLKIHHQCALERAEKDPAHPFFSLVNNAMGTIMSRAYSLPLSHERPAIGAYSEPERTECTWST